MELERSKGKSKVEVKDIRCGEALSDAEKDSIREIINGWLDDGEVEWFEKPLDEVRGEKIDSILEKE